MKIPHFFEWDEDKCQANIDKHGIDFANIQAVFTNPIVEHVDDRRDYGETRIILLGIIDNRVFIPCAVLSVVLLVLGRQINVNKKLITRVSLEEWAKMKGQTDWARIDAMTEEEIEQNALSDPDNQPLTDEFWDKAEVVFPSIVSQNMK